MNLAPQRASITGSLFCHSVRMDIVTWPMWTLASVPQGFSEAPRTPVWSLDWGQHASHESPLESCIQGPLGQPVQATGYIHYRGGCCLQPLHTGPPRGKEHSRLNWLRRREPKNRLARVPARCHWAPLKANRPMTTPATCLLADYVIRCK